MGNRVWAGLAAIWLLASSPAMAASENIPPMSGLRLQKLCKAKISDPNRLVCIAYISGLLDGMMTFKGGDKAGKRNVICLPGNTDVGQNVAIMDKAFKDFPNTSLPASVFAYVVFMMAYPCDDNDQPAAR